jgi:hypothetical protein
VVLEEVRNEHRELVLQAAERRSERRHLTMRLAFIFLFLAFIFLFLAFLFLEFGHTDRQLVEETVRLLLAFLGGYGLKATLAAPRLPKKKPEVEK